MSTGGATMAHILIVDDDEALAEMLGIVSVSYTHLTLPTKA